MHRHRNAADTKLTCTPWLYVVASCFFLRAHTAHLLASEQERIPGLSSSSPPPLPVLASLFLFSLSFLFYFFFFFSFGWVHWWWWWWTLTGGPKRPLENLSTVRGQPAEVEKLDGGAGFQSRCKRVTAVHSRPTDREAAREEGGRGKGEGRGERELDSVKQRIRKASGYFKSRLCKYLPLFFRPPRLVYFSFAFFFSLSLFLPLLFHLFSLPPFPPSFFFSSLFSSPLSQLDTEENDSELLGK